MASMLNGIFGNFANAIVKEQMIDQDCWMKLLVYNIVGGQEPRQVSCFD